MFTGSTKLPPAKTPQPERLDEVYAALRRGLQSYLQVHQLELDSLGQQIRENKRNGRLGSLYELDKQVKAIERFMRRLEFHLSKVEELYDAYCIQRRLRDGASKMVAAFNSATGSKEARESLSEANKGYRECTEHMCSLEGDLESQMGEFHVKMKGLAGFARLCAGDQYEVLMRYGRQRWRLRGRVEVSAKQIWDSEDYIFLPLVTELLSIKVTELKSLANHVVVGSVSCEMLDLFCPLPQTLAVDINDLGTVKLNLEVTWSPFDKDDQTSSTSTVTKRLLSNQSPPDTPSMREQVFYSVPHGRPRPNCSVPEAFHDVATDRTASLHCEFGHTTPRFTSVQSSLLKRQGEMENGTVWSNSSESSDDSSSPALAHHAQRLTASNMLQTTLPSQLSLTPHKSSASTPSLSSNQEEDETEAGEVFSQTDAVPNGHLQTSCSHSLVGESSPDCTVTDRASLRSADLSDTSADLSCSCPDVSSVPPVSLVERADVPESGIPQVCVSAEVVKDDPCEDSSLQAEAEAGDSTTEAKGGNQLEAAEKHSQPHPSSPELKQAEAAPTVSFPTSSSFIQEVETALESFDFLNCSDLDEEEEEQQVKNEGEKEKEQGEKDKGEKEEQLEKDEGEKEEEQGEKDEGKKEEERQEKDEGEKEEEQGEKDEGKKEEECGQNDDNQHKVEEEEKDEGNFYSGGSDDEEEGGGLEILMEAPEGFRNSDEDRFSESQESSVEDVQDLREIELPEDKEEPSKGKGAERHGEDASHDQEERPSTPSHLATTVF
ncbi:rho family-interacting cell polarization regulator 2-like isoform X1 [Hippoglossus hippoglossus]|uniref:rho family-interacting cell polarization regulator 2-like isoform X1 n=1 Tax=Hippoglossus hippoglossus TaxID=8267 RepID=UPI00148DFA91|nr:rho family-interacting cell polarization regulator 2-like isoform X1 [Hippoglossus hippoglossus]XP_034436942.1 rho family-interacting cell polarization regulator 2-like isoform X2 [Hippoglossus hippoglossus]XP_034436945.1 rho family-interacting cell polarization regulator 2-like isoform X1 [Hippoglossus hippoglossus]